jgi:2-keto-3-deoxygluconate permease
MDLAVFFHSDVLLGGLTLGLMTTVLTGFAGMLVLKLFRERSQIAGWAEGSTAGNAIGTPAAVMLAAEAAAKAGKMPPEIATKYKDILETATAQVSISTLTTAILCPVAVILWNRYQLSKGIDGTSDAV